MKYFHQGWKFCLTGRFPLKEAEEQGRDGSGRLFYECAFDDTAWETVTLPHTFNDGELFATPIQDGGSGQTRCVAFYRNWLSIEAGTPYSRFILAFEGVRQTCYVYVNEQLAGYYEAGVGPFGIDISSYIKCGEKNLIAIATDNTSTRRIPFCIAETPNEPGVEPGSYLQPQDQTVPENVRGVGFQWNCNDFNPTMGGIIHPLRFYEKRDVYLTLPLYANLQTKGTYLYAQKFDFEKNTAVLTAEAEVRNESGKARDLRVRILLKDRTGRVMAEFSSAGQTVQPVKLPKQPLSLVPEDAYRFSEEKGRFEQVPESQVAGTVTESVGTTVLTAQSGELPLHFWSIADPYQYQVEILLYEGEMLLDQEEMETGFREVSYDPKRGLLLNRQPVWLRGYAQRAADEWAAAGIVPEWMHDWEAALIRESNANHIRFMHVAAAPEDIRACDRQGIICTQPAGDKEQETFDRQWDQRVELMRNVLIAYRNHPAIVFWEAGNNVISTEHMREMRLLKEQLDPHGFRFMGCRTLNTADAIDESEYVGTMLNRHASAYAAQHGPITETEYAREEAPRRIWDDFTPPFYDYPCKWLGKGGKKQVGRDFYDLTSEDLAIEDAKGYREFFHDRIGGASGRNYYSACAALCWTDSVQHGRQSWSENGRMSGRTDAIRNKKQSFSVFQVMQAEQPQIQILGHWNYPSLQEGTYQYPNKQFRDGYWQEDGTFGHRDPQHKTVYVAGSYAIQRVELLINGEKAGSCEQPVETFLFPFPDIDVTRSGAVEAIGYGYDGKKAAVSRIETAGEPAVLELAVTTGPEGFLADGNDLAFVDIRVTDRQGRICPLCEEKIRFRTEGEAVFLGGYNSGRFDGNGREDNVIHKDFVYAECGTNRVLLRSTGKAGTIRLQAVTESGIRQELTWNSVECDRSVCSSRKPQALYRTDGGAHEADDHGSGFFPANPEADRVKYIPDQEDYCKIMVNGQEPDFRGIRAVNKKGSIWGNVLCVLERMEQMARGTDKEFQFSFDRDRKKLIVRTKAHTLEAGVGVTHLLVDGQENLMDGQPWIAESGDLVMEVNALVSQMENVQVQYDEQIHALRITFS